MIKCIMHFSNLASPGIDTDGGVHGDEHKADEDGVDDRHDTARYRIHYVP